MVNLNTKLEFYLPIIKMKNVDLYESFVSRDDEENDPEMALSEFIGEIWPEINKYLDDNGLESDYLIADPESFIIEYWPKTMNGAIPSRISYIIDALKEKLESEMQIGISWSFGPNGNAQRLIFTLDSEIEPDAVTDKILRVKKALKFT